MPRRVWDRFDQEAEREGSAFTKQMSMQISKRALGRKTIKERRMHKDAEVLVSNKTCRNYVS